MGLTPSSVSIHTLLDQFEKASNREAIARHDLMTSLMGSTSHSLTQMEHARTEAYDALITALSKMRIPEEVPSHRLNKDKNVVVGNHEWISMQHCPKSAKVWLLNPGCVGTQGEWDGKERQWLGWFPLPTVPNWMRSPIRPS